MTEILEKILNAQGGILNLILGIALIICLYMWFFFVFIKKNVKSAFFLQILALPISFKSQNLIGFVVYNKTSSYTDIFGLTSIWFFVLYFISKYILRYDIPEDKGIKNILLFYIIYAILGTITQFITHGFKDTFFLSYLGYWQYFIYISLMLFFIKTPADSERFVKMLIMAVILGIIIRIFNDGYLFVDIDSVEGRVGTNSAFGRLGQYGCYLTMMLYVVFYFVISEKNNIKILMWLLIFSIIMVEMFGNLTRGAVLQLVFFIGIPFLIYQRKRIFILLILFYSVSFLISPFVLSLITVRGLEFNLDFFLNRDTGAIVRFYLWKEQFPLIFKNMGIGYGIANEPHLYVSMMNRYLPSHNFLITEAQRSGLYSIFFFIVFFYKILHRLYIKIKVDLKLKIQSINTYLFFSLLSWIFYAQTSSLTITYYERVEGTLVLFSILSLAIINSSQQKYQNVN